jgi:hypothetical protein
MQDDRESFYRCSTTPDVAVGFRVRRRAGANVCEMHFDDALERHIGLKLRRKEVKRRISARTRALGVQRWSHDTNRLILEAAADDPVIARCCEALASELAMIADRPFSPRLLLAALSITNRERLRWSKDGRLRTSGSATIRRGQLIKIPTYDVALVAALIADPSIIAGWRNDDRRVGLRLGQPTG